MDNSIEFANISFSYGEHKVLENVSLKVEKGGFIAILGHNGAGKTTLMKLALGLLKPQQGNIRILGTDIEFFRNWDKIGYVQQTVEDFDFQFPATVMEVVLMGRLSRKKGVFKYFEEDDYSAAINAIKIIGIDEIKNKKIGKLSGGQRQKVFLAKTLCSEAEILFLDEPTAAMDYNSQHGFYDMLQKLNNELGITIVLITHDIGQVLQHVKKVIVINKMITFEGEPHKFNKNMIWEITERV